MVLKTVSDVAMVKREVHSYFAGLFKETMSNRPTLDGAMFSKLSEDQKYSMVEAFTEEEVRAVVFQVDGNKSPDPMVSI